MEIINDGKVNTVEQPEYASVRPIMCITPRLIKLNEVMSR